MKLNINAGHGGSDPGTVGNGLKEADLARKITAEISKQAKARGITVTDSTTSGDLKGAIKLANASGAELALSIHINSGGGSGFEVWYADNTTAANIARAKAISTALAKYYGLPDRGAKKDSTNRYGRLGWCRDTTMPALLIEWGFIDNKADMQKITSDIPGGVRVLLDVVAGAAAPVPMSAPAKATTPAVPPATYALPKKGMTDKEIGLLQAAIGTKVDYDWGSDSEKKYNAWRPRDKNIGKIKRGNATKAETEWVQYITGAAVDGKWQTKTDDAVKASQKKAGLTPDAWVGPKTLDAWGYR